MQEKIISKQERIKELIQKKAERLEKLELMAQLSPKATEVIGCAYVLPLTQVEYLGHYGMSRDDEGYDIRSFSPEGIKRYIEVKGRSGADGSVMVNENEMNHLAQLGDSAWLYIIINCKSKPELHRIQNPAKTLKFHQKTKGIQFSLPMDEWKNKINNVQ